MQSALEIKVKGSLLSSVAPAVAVASVVSAEQIAERAVFPHCVYKGDEYGGAAAGQHALETVFRTTCG